MFGTGTMLTRLLFSGIGLLCLGMWIYVPTQNASQQETLDIAKMQHGLEPKSNWVKIKGKLAWEEGVVIENKYGHEVGYVLPVVSQNWNPGQPMKVFAYFSASSDTMTEERDYETVEGLIRPLGMPLDVRAVLADSNVAASPIYIEHGTDPKSQRRLAHVIILLGLVFTGAGSSPFWLPKLAGDTGDTPRRKEPNEEQLAIAAQRDLERQSEVDQWLASRGIDYGIETTESNSQTEDADEARELAEV